VLQPAADVIDRAVVSPVMVYGSLPQLGTDLDLLVRSDELLPVIGALKQAGFSEASGGRWWRSSALGIEVVELRSAEAWGLPPQELADLFAKAVAVERYAHLVRPSSAHTLLLLARRLTHGDGTLDERRRARLERALAEDPAAWPSAEARARAWRSLAALRVLRAASMGKPVGTRQLVDARAERYSGAGLSRRFPRARAWRSLLPRRQRGGVIAICGLDGAGKSSQAAALVAGLELLGQPSVSRWTRLSADPSLDAVARPVKRLLRAVRRRSPPRISGDVHPSRVASPEQRLRQASPVLTWAWATLVAGLNGLAQRRSTRSDVASGRVVVCDRWTLDSAVHLRYRYGEERRFTIQVRLIRALSPRPLTTFLLDIPAETAYRRKDDHYDVSQLRRQERLYNQEHGSHGAIVLDGTRPAPDLSAEIVRATLDILQGRRRRRRVGRR